jgi:hypothetical protein
VYYRFFYAFNMLTIPYIKENKDQVLKGLQIKNFNHPELIDQVLELDNERRALQSKTNELQALMNTLSKEIGQLFKSGRQGQSQPAKRKNHWNQAATGSPGKGISGRQSANERLAGANTQCTTPLCSCRKERSR